jgi:hypothetical protein
MEAALFSEALEPAYEIAWLLNLMEHQHLSHGPENLKSHIDHVFTVQRAMIQTRNG